MFSLPKLPYSLDALEPYIDAKTMDIHHSKHHAGYVDKLNKALDDLDDVEKNDVGKLLMNLDKIPKNLKQVVINNAGGHANHSLFWEIMIPSKKYQEPSGGLTSELDKFFGTFEKFKKEFSEKALALFGSGWVFLISDKDKKLSIKRHSFQNSPIMHGNIPLMGIDVWEHAYYLKYQNRRVDYIDAWWKVVNWERVEENLMKAKV